MNKILLSLALTASVSVMPLFLPQAWAAPETAAAATAPEAGDEIKKEMERLVEEAIKPLAVELEKSDHFTPYGVLRKKDGGLQMLRWGKPNPPEDMQVFREINRMIRDQTKRPEIVAAVTVATTTIPTADGKGQVYGIRAEVDHREGTPLVVVVPYARENGKLVLGTLIYRVGKNPMFDRPKAVEAPEAATPAAPAKAAAPGTKPAASSGKQGAPKSGAAKP